MDRNLRDLRTQCEVWLAEGDPDRVLQRIESLVKDVWRNPLGACRIFGSPLLDELLMEVGGSIANGGTSISVGDIGNFDQIFVASSLGTAGGHTGVIKDIARLGGVANSLVLVTDRSTFSDEVRRHFEVLGVEVRAVPGEMPSQQVSWLQNVFREKLDVRVWLFNHWWDSVAVAAFVPIPGAKHYFVHHADHHLCLGIHLPHLRHVDLSPLSYHHCRDDMGVGENVYLPLTLCDPPSPSDSNHQGPHWRTATSGSWFKFSAPHAWHLWDVLPNLLKASGGEHLHIGPMPTEVIERLRGKLTEEGIDPHRFVHLEHVDSVARCLVDRKVDLYVGSFPYPGIKSGIEAMAVGIPIALPLSYQSSLQSSVNMVYKEAFHWRSPEELCEIVGEISGEVLRRHAVLSRDWFVRYHSPVLVSNILGSDFSGKHRINPRPEPDASIDHLQHFLDREAEFVQQEIHIDNHLKKIAGLRRKNEELRAERDSYRSKWRALKSKTAEKQDGGWVAKLWRRLH